MAINVQDLRWWHYAVLFVVGLGLRVLIKLVFGQYDLIVLAVCGFAIWKYTQRNTTDAEAALEAERASLSKELSQAKELVKEASTVRTMNGKKKDEKARFRQRSGRAFQGKRKKTSGGASAAGAGESKGSSSSRVDEID